MFAPPRLCYGVLGCVGICLGLGVERSMATPPAISPQEEEPSATTEPSEGGTSSGFMSGVARSSYLLGNMGGVRTDLSKYGISLNIAETSEVLGNVTGGSKQGADYDGLTQ